MRPPGHVSDVRPCESPAEALGRRRPAVADLRVPSGSHATVTPFERCVRRSLCDSVPHENNVIASHAGAFSVWEKHLKRGCTECDLAGSGPSHHAPELHFWPRARGPVNQDPRTKPGGLSA